MTEHVYAGTRTREQMAVLVGAAWALRKDAEQWPVVDQLPGDEAGQERLQEMLRELRFISVPGVTTADDPDGCEPIHEVYRALVRYAKRRITLDDLWRATALLMHQGGGDIKGLTHTVVYTLTDGSDDDYGPVEQYQPIVERLLRDVNCNGVPPPRRTRAVQRALDYVESLETDGHNAGYDAADCVRALCEEIRCATQAVLMVANFQAGFDVMSPDDPNYGDEE